MIDQDLASILSQWLSNQLEAVHTCMPASIVSYEGHKTRRATVQPCVNLQASSYLVPYKPVPSVPVLFPSTPRFSFVFDLEKGDTGMLFATESALGNWLASDGKPCDPEDATRFSLQDAIFVPGLFPFKKVPDHSAPNDGAFLSYNGTSIEFKKSGGLKIVGDVEVSGAIAATMDVSAMNLTPANAVRLSTHVHPTSVGPTSPPTLGT